jgi:ubiquinone/menaquinone biosynthesis C-methylase UbiE
LAEELTYKNEAAAGYDRAFARVTRHFVPFLLRAAHIAPGMRVLDIAAGTGLAAEVTLAVVGATGHVTAADLSRAMVEKARQRLGKAVNVSLAVEDGQALSYSDESFGRCPVQSRAYVLSKPVARPCRISPRTSFGRPRRRFR